MLNMACRPISVLVMASVPMQEKDIDFTFVNGNENDYRYSNLNVLNPYHGVTIVHDKGHTEYIAKLHLNGNYLIGRFPSLIEAAIAYNKAVDLACMHGCTKQFPQNYIDSLSPRSIWHITKNNAARSSAFLQIFLTASN